MEDKACSACPPAFAYSYFYLVALPRTLEMNKKALIAIKGMRAKRTKANNQPLTKATIIPAMHTETV